MNKKIILAVIALAGFGGLLFFLKNASSKS